MLSKWSSIAGSDGSESIPEEYVESSRRERGRGSSVSESASLVFSSRCLPSLCSSRSLVAGSGGSEPYGGPAVRGREKESVESLLGSIGSSEANDDRPGDRDRIDECVVLTEFPRSR